MSASFFFFFFQAEDGIRDHCVTGVQTCALPISWRIQAGDESVVLERAGDLQSITAAQVFDGARGGDGVSVSVVRDTARYIGMALANLTSCIDPEVIVLGGDAAIATDLLLEPCARITPAAFRPA